MILEASFLLFNASVSELVQSNSPFNYLSLEFGENQGDVLKKKICGKCKTLLKVSYSLPVGCLENERLALVQVRAH
jgi:hypothetical protein